MKTKTPRPDFVNDTTGGDGTVPWAAWVVLIGGFVFMVTAAVTPILGMLFLSQLLLKGCSQ